jgi:aminoglycoside phosphotransferase (APT) family kinase protein
VSVLRARPSAAAIGQGGREGGAEQADAVLVSRTDANTGDEEVRVGHGFDADSLAEWMAANVEGFEGPLSVRQFKGGQSNPTYRLATPKTHYVLRRKPPGALLAGAHAVEREARVMAAIGAAGFPTPRIHGLCEDPEVIGTAFYVMEMVEGRVLWDSTLSDMPRAERAAHYDAMNAAIAALHRIDPVKVGLGDYGPPTDYLQRQVRRWTRQYLHDAEDVGRIEELDRLIDWLPRNLPPVGETRIVHGDYKLDNMIFHPTRPEILAVLDWELSTLGDPLADFVFHLMVWRFPPALLSGLAGADLDGLGLPSESDYISAYCRRSGRAQMDHLDFYMAFNMFRFSAIIHGIKARVARGTAASAQANSLVENLPLAAKIAWRQVPA